MAFAISGTIVLARIPDFVTEKTLLNFDSSFTDDDVDSMSTIFYVVFSGSETAILDSYANGVLDRI